MSEDQSSYRTPAPVTACHACHGTGYVETPQLAVTGDGGETLIQRRRCKWCPDEHPGRLRGLTPPV